MASHHMKRVGFLLLAKEKVCIQAFDPQEKNIYLMLNLFYHKCKPLIRTIVDCDIF